MSPEDRELVSAQIMKMIVDARELQEQTMEISRQPAWYPPAVCAVLGVIFTGFGIILGRLFSL